MIWLTISIVTLALFYICSILELTVFKPDPIEYEIDEQFEQVQLRVIQRRRYRDEVIK